MNKQELIGKYEDKLKDVQLKFGANFKTKVYDDLVKDLKQLDEPQKVVVPQFVAEHIEWAKKEDFHLLGAMNRENFDKKLEDWFYTDDNMELFARAWLDGYTVEEKLYMVKVKGHINENILVYGYGIKIYFFSSNIKGNRRARHTRKQLEEAGFGEVFNSPLFEVEEVE
jgi:hypothetical protein|nr:MAG TPA: Protein of unknown function (DUF1642) [Caudoviricetes sp.]